MLLPVYPQPQNKELFYYPVSVGHFYCDSNYKIERNSFGSILVAYIVRGSFSFLLNGKEMTAQSGDIAVIDCFEHHTYYTNDNAEIYWLHICGANTYALFREITDRYSNIIPANENVEKSIVNIYDAIKSLRQITESEMSAEIYCFIMSLFTGTNFQGKKLLDKAIEYILNHYGENLTVDALADVVHLSASQFSRSFKRQTGISPYGYLLNVRLTKAKELLKNTSLSVGEIAEQTGFLSDSNFIYFFKKREGISPLKFRNLLLF